MGIGGVFGTTTNGECESIENGAKERVKRLERVPSGRSMRENCKKILAAIETLAVIERS